MQPVADLVEECHTRQTAHRWRTACYGRFLDAYHGVVEGSKDSAMDGSGRPILRMGDIRGELRQRTGAPNFIAPIVDDYCALKGTLPLLKVVPAAKEGVDRAEQRSMAIRAMWDASNMALQQQDAGFYLSCLGDALYVLDPLLPGDADDLNPAGIYITVYDPRLCFPKHRTGRWSEELDDVFVTWEVTAEAAHADYGVACDNDDELVEVILYYSRTEKRVIVDGRQAPRGNVEHKLTWCPAQWVRNKMVGGKYAQSDICQAVDVAEELQAITLVLNDAVIESVYAPIMVTDPDKVTGDLIEIGPRSVIAVEQGGNVSRIDPAPEPTSAYHTLQTLQDSLYHTTGQAPIRQQGSLDHANLSGRAVRSVQGGLEDRMDLFRTSCGYHMERLVQKQLLMYGRIPELSAANMTLSGSDKGKSYEVTFTGEEIAGSSRVQAKWDIKLGSTRHERLVMALQVYTQGLVPAWYVVQQLDEDDPELLVKLAQDEKMKLAQAQMAMQPPPQQGGPQQGGPPGGPQSDPSAQANSLAGGGGTSGDPASSAAAGGGAPPPVGGQAAAGGGPPGGGGGDAGGGGMPPFSALSMPQNGTMGPPPQTPDLMTMIRFAMDQIPPRQKAMIAGDPVPTDRGIVVPISDWKASSVIKRAFSAVGLKAVPEVIR